MKRIHRPAVCIIISLIALVSATAQQPSLDTLLTHVRTLASARYAGRLAGTEAYMDATQYTIDALQRYGVKPYQGDWIQHFEVECNEIENCSFNTYYNNSDTRTVYVLGNDFSCAGMTGRGYADANVVFCGYGIDDASYNEYEKVDAQGKIALVLSGVPSFLPSKVADRYRTPRDKARAARRHGCCALVIINMSSSCSPNEVQTNVYSGEGPHLPTFPIIQPHRSCGAQLLADERISLDSVIDLLQTTMRPQSFHLRKRFEININAKYHPAALTGNVVGIMPGADSKMNNEYIVVGAHLDHLGMQGNTCIYPGADANASGVAVLLETARLLQAAEERPGRSIIFVLFSAAENQRLGSQIFVSNFNPLKHVEAFVGIECVGSGDSLAVLGNNKYPGLWQVANQMDSAHTQMMVHNFKTNPKGDALAFDHVGIPSITLTNYNGNLKWHVPSDIPENIYRGMITKAAHLSFETVYELSFGDYQGRSAQSRRYRFE